MQEQRILKLVKYTSEYISLEGRANHVRQVLHFIGIAGFDLYRITDDLCKVYFSHKDDIGKFVKLFNEKGQLVILDFKNVA
ncbi:hypothetical protein RYZ26_06755 [Terasakiella sp. A23]|uniref:hypothetical protein n=1 Tax=Terasakiella sp. FCG-A23 TaxID=3080561 RepID=UPI00295368EF|nr:hypothetical protein [Terasakiella sp. A23]MDV7339286.1 hypothetical protein [Terasakiella sp. A23]